MRALLLPGPSGSLGKLGWLEARGPKKLLVGILVVWKHEKQQTDSRRWKSRDR